MSSNKVIRRNDPASVKAWRPGDLAKPPPVANVAPAPKAEARPESRPEPAKPEPVAPVVPLAVVTPPPQPDPAEIDAIRERARQEGYDAGRAEGLRDAAPDLERFRSLLAQLHVLAEDLEQGIANDVMSLALELTKQILRQSLRVKPEIVLAVIRDATRSFPELGASPRLILHPEDAAVLRAVVGATDDVELSGWVLVEDARIERGGCKFQNSTTEIDSTLENRWRRIVASLGRDDAWLDLNL